MGQFLQNFVFAYILFFSANLFADTSQPISIIELNSYVNEEKLFVDCEVQYRVDKRIREALSNGIEMTFLLEIDLRQKHDLMFDKTLGKYIHQFRIKYHALSKQYVMIEKGSDTELSFSDLYSAFYYQRNLHKAELAAANLLEQNSNLYIHARARLVSEKLPLPLRIKSYLSKDWRPSSGWTKWPI